MIYENELLMAAMRTMPIGNMQPHEQQKEQDQPSSSMMAQPLSQDEEHVPHDNGMDQRRVDE
jgi:hypothetical protein